MLRLGITLDQLRANNIAYSVCNEGAASHNRLFRCTSNIASTDRNNKTYHGTEKPR